MSFWPSDTAGRIADVIAGTSFVGSLLTFFYAKARGNAADRAVKELKRDLHRRDLLPTAAGNFQKMYRKLLPVLSNPTDPVSINPKLGELRGMVNGLSNYLYDTEKGTLLIIKMRLDLIAKEPADLTHLSVLLNNMGTLSSELDFIVEQVTWDRQS